MKNIIVDNRHFTFDGYKSILTEKEDGYTIVLEREENPLIKKSETTEQALRAMIMLRYTDDSISDYIWVIKVNRQTGDFFMGRKERKWTLIGKSLFVKTAWLSVIRYDAKSKRVITSKSWIGIPNSITPEFEIFLRFFGAECLIESPVSERSSACMVNRLLTNKTVLKGIITGKITNRRQAVGIWYTSVTKKKMSNYLALEEYANYLDTYYAISLVDIETYTENAGNTISLLAKIIKASYEGRDKEARDYFGLFKDHLTDCKILQRKLNAKWSSKRLAEEHRKCTKLIGEAIAGSYDKDAVFYDKPISVKGNGVQGHILNTAGETLVESLEQQNCIYSHYTARMVNKEYIGISLTKPERATFGIRVGYNELEWDQLRGYKNKSVSEETQSAVEKWFERHKKELVKMCGIKETAGVIPQAPVFRDNDYLPF